MTRNIANVGYHICAIFLITAYTKGTNVAHPSINEGTSIMLQCNVTLATFKTDIYWTKNSTGSTFNVSGKNLIFNNISRAVAGQYLCHSLNKTTGEDSIIEIVQLEVNYGASVKSISVLPSVVQENGTYTVTCDFDGKPAPKWQIRLKDSIIAVGQGSGVKTKVHKGTCGETGHVTCNAVNSVTNISASLMHNITVFCSPRPIWLNRYKVTASVGDFMALIMMAHGYPYPSYVWSRDDGQPIRTPTQTDLSEISVLNITNIRISDFANYSLTMNNSYGSYVAHYQLIQSVSPGNNGNSGRSRYNCDFSVFFGILTLVLMFDIIGRH